MGKPQTKTSSSTGSRFSALTPDQLPEGISAATSPGEISPPATGVSGPEVALEGIEREFVRRLSKTESLSIDDENKENEDPLGPVRYVAGNPLKAPPKRTDRGHNRELRRTESNSETKQVRYTSGGKILECGSKDELEPQRYHKSDMEAHGASSTNGGVEDRNADKPSYASVAKEPPAPDAEIVADSVNTDDGSGDNDNGNDDKPSYASVTKAPPPPESGDAEDEDADKSYVDVSKVSPSSEFGDAEDENADKPSYASVAKAPPAPDSEVVENPSSKTSGGPTSQKSSDEMEELKRISLGNGDFGVNIGDAFHQDLAHEEKEHDKLQNALRNKIAAVPPPLSPSQRLLDMDFAAEPTEFTSGPATPVVKHRGEPVEHKRPNADPDHGHKGPKIPRRSTDEGSSWRGSNGTTSNGTTHKQTQTANTNGTTKKAHKQTNQDLPDLVPRSEVISMLNARDSTISKLQNTLSELQSRIERLELNSSSEPTESQRRPEQVETFATVRTKDDWEDGEMAQCIKFCLWGGALLGVATLGGLVGAQVERGNVSRGVAEWVWKQAGGSGYQA